MDDILSADSLDRRLIALLRENARQPVTSLAQALSLSRASVYARLDRLERAGIIRGYTIRVGAEYDRHLIRAHVMLKVLPKLAKGVERQLGRMEELQALHVISGEYDMIAMIEADCVSSLNAVIDRIGALEGVEKTTSSILLATRFAKSEPEAVE